MLRQIERVKEQWGGRHDTIDKWLHARQQLLVQYCELLGLNQEQATLPDVSLINAFCEIMMDYLSAGHFEVYDMLVNHDERGTALKEAIYPKIANTTDHALIFNDRYTEAVTSDQAQSFDTDLSALGEVLEERFELEDELINHMFHNYAGDSAIDTPPRQQ